MTIMLSRTAVRRGETIDGVLVAENRSSDQVDITHPSSCPISFGLYRDGTLVGGTTPVACAQETQFDHLGARETRRWSFTLDTFAYASDPRPPLAPGRYQADAGVDVEDSGIWYAYELAVDILPS